MSLQGCPLDDEQRREALGEATDIAIDDAKRNRQTLIRESGREEFATGINLAELRRRTVQNLRFINRHWKRYFSEEKSTKEQKKQFPEIWSDVGVTFNHDVYVVFINNRLEDDKILRHEFGETVTEEDDEYEKMVASQEPVLEKIFINNKEAGNPQFRLPLSDKGRFKNYTPTHGYRAKESISLEMTILLKQQQQQQQLMAQLNGVDPPPLSELDGGGDAAAVLPNGMRAESEISITGPL